MPLPSDDAGAGLPVTAVEVADLPVAGPDYGTIAVLDVTMTACAPRSMFPDGCDVHD